MTAPHMTTTAPTTPAPVPAVPAGAGWAALSAAMTAATPPIAARRDLSVTIAPGAAGGGLALFVPAHAAIEINGEHLGIDPATARPARVCDRYRYAPTWGSLVHECAHAAHTRWNRAACTEPEVMAAAVLLEESRIEAAQLRRRAEDRHWLRASTRALVFADTGGPEAILSAPPTRFAAAHQAALLLARVDAGVLDPAETTSAATAIETILGRALLRQLRTLWRIAHRLSDTNTHGMLELARRWFALVGPDPHATPVPGSPLGRAIAGTLGDIAKSVASEPVPADPDDVADRAAAARDAEDRDNDRAGAVAGKVFDPNAPRARWRATRAPRANERAAARVLARGLNTASARERAVTKTTSALPPGRVRMRAVVAREAQRAAGAVPTAQPFTRTTRSAVPVPPLRIGIACDVSGSMRRYVGEVASAAWIVAQAANLAVMPAATATVTFGSAVIPVTYPATAPARVTEFTASGSWEAIDTALDALDGALGLSKRENTRLLVIISDGRFEPEPRAAAQKRLDRLRASGCAVLWLATGLLPTPLDGATVHTLTDPAAAADTIARAATAAVRTA
ncbi:vWA domain-containing protein [Nocardia uniformis]|nr:vWA domain-containing protein [Nocardia uniformis]